VSIICPLMPKPMAFVNIVRISPLILGLTTAYVVGLKDVPLCDGLLSHFVFLLEVTEHLCDWACQSICSSVFALFFTIQSPFLLFLFFLFTDMLLDLN
jgi:hypothetical protein